MLVPDNPLFGPPPSEVTPNDSDNAKAVIFKRRNAFSYVRPPYSSSCSPSSKASSKSCLRMRRELEAHVASIDRCRLHYVAPTYGSGSAVRAAENTRGEARALPVARVFAGSGKARGHSDRAISEHFVPVWPGHSIWMLKV